jgi:MAF protein
MTEVFLASKSPRRQMLLRSLIDHFIVIQSEVNEDQVPGETPEDYVRRLAAEKARWAGNQLASSTLDDVIVIGADTAVVDQQRIIGKPEDDDDARMILQSLRDNIHQVYSGLAIYLPEQKILISRTVKTDVKMRDYSDDEIELYISSRDPFDKAGAYGIQNEVFDPAPEFNDCFANVMGLPLCHLTLLLSTAGFQDGTDVADKCQELIQYQCPVYQRILSEIPGFFDETKDNE